MLKDIVCDIENYIEYLNKTYSLYISLHPKAYEEFISTTGLRRFITHTVPYCLYLKKYPEVSRHCVACQDKVFKRCSEGEFTGVCHAGVFEYVYPFYGEKCVKGFVSVSGYRAYEERANASTHHLSLKYGLPYDELQNYYKSLKKEKPDSRFIDMLLHPLCHMLELVYNYLPEMGREINKTRDFYTKILYYLDRNHCSRISLDDMCEHLNCSKSYISHIFKKYNGHTISEYLNIIRVSEAKMLLVNSGLNITQVALSVGFSDSNYFAVVFKRLEGMTPRKYRENI